MAHKNRFFRFWRHFSGVIPGFYFFATLFTTRTFPLFPLSLHFLLKTRHFYVQDSRDWPISQLIGAFYAGENG
jgi:hypothetical protein